MPKLVREVRGQTAMKPFQVNVSSRYGAPMGRRYDKLDAVKGRVHLQSVPFVDGCYDQGGAYWGSPANLWCAWGESEDEQLVTFLRAPSREAAKSKLLAEYPELKFYR